MARYIDADNLAQRIMYYMSHTPERCGEHYAYKAALKEIVGSPTADVVEVKHGEWIEKEEVYGDVYYTCSECNNDWTTIDGTPQENFMNYCPYCGAKMDGGNAE